MELKLNEQEIKILKEAAVQDTLQRNLERAVDQLQGIKTFGTGLDPATRETLKQQFAQFTATAARTSKLDVGIFKDYIREAVQKILPPGEVETFVQNVLYLARSMKDVY